MNSLVSTIRRELTASLLVSSVVFVILVKILTVFIGVTLAFWVSLVALVAFVLWALWPRMQRGLVITFIAGIATAFLAMLLSTLTEAITGGNLLWAVICVIVVIATTLALKRR